MLCGSVPGTWTGTETPGDMSPEWKRKGGNRAVIFGAQCSFCHPSAGRHNRQAQSKKVCLSLLKAHPPVLELAEGGVCRCGEEYADESKLRGAEGDGGSMQE